MLRGGSKQAILVRNDRCNCTRLVLSPNATVDVLPYSRGTSLGYIDEEGSLRLVGRLKDVIRTGGENVHATEVEAALEKHPRVLRASVVGIPHARLGEQVFNGHKSFCKISQCNKVG